MAIGLYKYFWVYEQDGGCSERFWQLIDEQYSVYDVVELAYWQSVIEKELTWRIGAKADYLQSVQLVVLKYLSQKQEPFSIG